MRPLAIARPGEALSVLCLGAHSDDIEIGAGGTLLTWLADGVVLDVHWCVLSACDAREQEARGSACAFLEGARLQTIEVAAFRDGYFPTEQGRIKDWFEGLKTRVAPEVILTR